MGDARVHGKVFGLTFGGLACIRHLVLRIMLWRNGFAPLNYARFLDYAAGHIHPYALTHLKTAPLLHPRGH